MSQLFPEGYYTGKVVSVELVSSATKGTPGVRVEIEVEGHKRKVDWWLSGKAEEYALEKLRRIQVDLATDPPSFSGEDFEWSCKHTMPNEKGKVFEDWDIARGSAAAKPMDSDRVRLLKAKLSAGQPARPSTPPPKAPAAPAASKPPSRPPAKPAAPVKPKVTYADGDAAWAALVTFYAEPVAKEWERIIAEVEAKSKRGQDAFTPEDWAAVVDGYIPM